MLWSNAWGESESIRGTGMMSDREASQSATLGCSTPHGHRFHLQSLSIEGFRGIKELSIPRLGRATLLAGRNGVGKTTVLDAVRVYASRARLTALSELLMSREEIAVRKDADRTEMPAFDGKALFHGRDTSGDARISIGPLDDGDRLRIEIAALGGEPESMPGALLAKSIGAGARVMKVTFGDSTELLPSGPQPFPGEFMQLFAESGSEMPPELACQSLGPGLPDAADVARLWDRITLTDDEDRVIQAVNLAVDEEVVRVAVVGDVSGNGQGLIGRRLVARLKGHRHPVPLRSLGDGVVRLLGFAAALANSKDGFLLLDEAENGIHHTLQRDFWRMVLQTAQDNNVQVLATTHGWDCVRGFAQAAADLDAVEGVLVRLERSGDRTSSIEYLEDDLDIATQGGIEVR